MGEEARIGGPEETDVGDGEEDHGESVEAEAEGPAGFVGLAWRPSEARRVGKGGRGGGREGARGGLVGGEGVRNHRKEGGADSMARRPGELSNSM